MFKTPEWTRPAAWSFVAGAIVITIIGFSTGAVVSSSTAEDMVDEQTNASLVAALTPICTFKASDSPDAEAKIAGLREESSWSRDDYVADQGWATMAGAERPVDGVAEACAEALMKAFPK